MNAHQEAQSAQNADVRAPVYGLVYINAGNDVNGNPRRGWIIRYGSDNPGFVDEGYLGPHALEKHGIPNHEGRYLPQLKVTAREYRRWAKIGMGNRA